MKNPFKRKKQSIPTAPEPRDLEAINAEYRDLMGRAARAQYLSYIHAEELKQINQRLVAVNNEADIRMKLNQAAEDVVKAQAAKEEANVQSQQS